MSEEKVVGKKSVTYGFIENLLSIRRSLPTLIVAVVGIWKLLIYEHYIQYGEWFNYWDGSSLGLINVIYPTWGLFIQNGILPLLLIGFVVFVTLANARSSYNSKLMRMVSSLYNVPGMGIVLLYSLLITISMLALFTSAILSVYLELVDLDGKYHLNPRVFFVDQAFNSYFLVLFSVILGGFYEALRWGRAHPFPGLRIGKSQYSVVVSKFGRKCELHHGSNNKESKDFTWEKTKHALRSVVRNNPEIMELELDTWMLTERKENQNKEATLRRISKVLESEGFETSIEKVTGPKNPVLGWAYGKIRKMGVELRDIKMKSSGNTKQEGVPSTCYVWSLKRSNHV